MADLIRVRLAPHRIGFYDPVNRIHLAKGMTEEAALAASSDLRYIRAAVKSGGLILLEGTLSEPEKAAEPEPLPVAGTHPAPVQVAVMDVPAEPAPQAAAPAAQPAAPKEPEAKPPKRSRKKG